MRKTLFMKVQKTFVQKFLGLFVHVQKWILQKNTAWKARIILTCTQIRVGKIFQLSKQHFSVEIILGIITK